MKMPPEPVKDVFVFRGMEAVNSAVGGRKQRESAGIRRKGGLGEGGGVAFRCNQRGRGHVSLMSMNKHGG